MTVNIEWALYGTENERYTHLGRVLDEVVQKLRDGWGIQEVVDYYDGFISKSAVYRTAKRLREGKFDRRRGVRPKEYHFYVLQCPVTGQFRYVGASTQPWNRIGAHCWQPTNPGMKKWTKWLARQKLRPRLIVLQTRITDEPEPIELDWIDHFCRAGHPMLNINGCERC